MILILHNTSDLVRTVNSENGRTDTWEGKACCACVLHKVCHTGNLAKRSSLHYPLVLSSQSTYSSTRYAILVPLTLPDEFTWINSPSNS
jgi:hypothetical protein